MNARGNHRDDAYYPSANTFDGFRFARGDGVDQQMMVTPTLDYIAFGHGRPTWCVFSAKIRYATLTLDSVTVPGVSLQSQS